MSQNTVIDSNFLIIDIQMNNCGRNYCIKKNRSNVVRSL
jgi:hypothetical protein